MVLTSAKKKKPTDKKANAEKAVQMVKGFLNALDLKPSDKMEALTLFGQLDNLAQMEALTLFGLLL